MLVLSRKLMESIHIGDNIVVTVVRLDRGQVRLAIEAPKSVNIYRAEILDRYEPEGGTDGHDRR